MPKDENSSTQYRELLSLLQRILQNQKFLEEIDLYKKSDSQNYYQSKEYYEYLHMQLFKSVEQHDLDAFETLRNQYLLYCREDIDFSYDDGIFYKIAVKQGDIEILEYLCNKDINPLQKHATQVLGYSVMHNHTNCVKYLIKDLGIDPQVLKYTTAYNKCKNIQQELLSEKDSENIYQDFVRNDTDDHKHVEHSDDAQYCELKLGGDA